jgi:hypothetical protein
MEVSLKEAAALLRDISEKVAASLSFFVSLRSNFEAKFQFLVN